MTAFDAEFLLDATTYFRALDHALRVVTGKPEERIPAAPEHREMVTTEMDGQSRGGERTKALK